jgi:hypothetical protein
MHLSPLPSSFVGPGIFLCTLFSNTLILYLVSVWVTKFYSHTKWQQNYSAVYFNLYTYRLQTGRQKVFHQKIASIPEFSLLLISA